MIGADISPLTAESQHGSVTTGAESPQSAATAGASQLTGAGGQQDTGGQAETGGQHSAFDTTCWQRSRPSSQPAEAGLTVITTIVQPTIDE